MWKAIIHSTQQKSLTLLPRQAGTSKQANDAKGPEKLVANAIQDRNGEASISWTPWLSSKKESRQSVKISNLK